MESGKYLAGAVFNLYTADDIYDADGSLVFAAGELVATSPETNADGTTCFDCDIPIRGEQYGSSTHKDAATNSGKYIIEEIRAPLGYYVNEEPMEVTFTYDGEAVQVLESTCTNKPTEMWVSKRDLTNDEELPGATLTIQDAWKMCQAEGLLSPLYALTGRGGCWFCPNASMRELRHLYNAHPDLWQLLLELQDAPNKATERFNRSYTLHDLDLRFSLEGEQLSFFTYGER